MEGREREGIEPVVRNFRRKLSNVHVLFFLYKICYQSSGRKSFTFSQFFINIFS